MRNPFVVVSILVAIIIGGGVAYDRYGRHIPPSKLYVAAEGEGKIAVIDPSTNKVIKDIHLYSEHDGERIHYMPHNVQVSPDNKSVWVTGNVGGHEHASRFIPIASANGDEHPSDSVMVINPRRDTIVTIIPLGAEIHTAHVVLSPDSKFAYVTTQQESAIYKINTANYKVEKKIAARTGSEPHGLRIAPDGLTAYVAVLKGKALGIIDLKTDDYSEVPLRGSAVQVGITPDGKYVVASLYDTKELAVYETGSKPIRYIELPKTSRGPIQMYPTPDSRFFYLADQGYYFGEPESEWVYKVDVENGSVVKEIKAGRAPHGVVVSPDGSSIYVTNLLSNDVSVIDTSEDREVARIPVGKEPNGISFWENN